jgi:flagellar biosynthetic protein FliP
MMLTTIAIAVLQQSATTAPAAASTDGGLSAGIDGLVHAASEGRLSTAVEVAVLLTALSLLPAVLVTVTSFTRIMIVLSFVRRAIGVNELPPNPVIIGLSLFLTAFVMAPVGERMYANAWIPYRKAEISAEVAGTNAWGELRGFLLANTRQSELALFTDLAKLPPTSDASDAPIDPPARVLVPAFVLSELKTAFQMGFLLFLPFLVIDLVVSSVLLSMGMFMMPPVMISTPLKILLFVLVDGWSLVCQSLVTSFVTT